MRDVRTGEPLWSKCCSVCKCVGDTWGLGNVFLGEFTEDSAQYCAQYTTKKLNRSDMKLGDRYPERAWMSNRPGIGADFMHDVGSSLMEFSLEDLPDVPSALRHGSRIMPLGRYLRKRLRKVVGRDEKAPQSTLDEAKERLQPMREAAFDASESFKDTVIRAADGKVAQMEARQRIFRKDRKL